jgi:hypothetical protein
MTGDYIIVPSFVPRVDGHLAVIAFFTEDSCICYECITGKLRSESVIKLRKPSNDFKKLFIKNQLFSNFREAAIEARCDIANFKVPNRYWKICSLHPDNRVKHYEKNPYGEFNTIKKVSRFPTPGESSGYPVEEIPGAEPVLAATLQNMDDRYWESNIQANLENKKKVVPMGIVFLAGALLLGTLIMA